MAANYALFFEAMRASELVYTPSCVYIYISPIITFCSQVGVIAVQQVLLSVLLLNLASGILCCPCFTLTLSQSFISVQDFYFISMCFHGATVVYYNTRTFINSVCYSGQHLNYSSITTCQAIVLQRLRHILVALYFCMLFL